jgi:hypothetical protein
MRKRPKYKIGDVLECWIVKKDGSMETWNYFIVGLSRERSLSGKIIFFYDIKSFDNAPPCMIDSTMIDMKSGKYANCKMGLRRVA